MCVAVRIENNSVLIVFLQMSGWLGMKSNLCIFAAVIENTVKLENISTAYGRSATVCITKNFSASLSAGTFTCLLGMNGAGKSTLLRTMAGLQPPTSGHIYVNGVELSQYSRRELARMVGVVLTERQAFSAQMTVEELVSLGRIPYTDFSGKLGDDDREMVENALARTGMRKMRRRPVASLSDGERQKTMIAKTLAQQTPVILLDEPTAFLDFESKIETFALLRSLSRENRKAIVVATHDLGTAFRVADILWIMKRGTTPVCGSPEQLAAEGVLDMFFNMPGVEFNRKDMSYSISIDKQKR